MEDIRTLHLRLLQGRLGDIAYQLARVQYTSLRPLPTWHPAINAYRCRESLVLCVDLAGVERTRIDVQVEPRRVLIRGQRPPQQPAGSVGPPLQVLALEIDEGPFEREIVLPLAVNPERVRAEQDNGLLWIILPLAEAS